MITRTFYLNAEKTVYINAYLLSPIEGTDNLARPGILIFPGGGYQFCSEREAEPIALHYLAQGFNAFVLFYTCSEPYPASFSNAAYAMYKIKMRASEFGIDPNRLAVAGFSAGGHLAGCLATMWNTSGIVKALNCQPEDIRPAAAILAYPVVSGIIAPHAGSFAVLLDCEIEEANTNDVARLSLENRVNPETPPIFIWCTADDDVVHAQNSLVLANACVVNHVPCELHMYDHGPHGLSDCSLNTNAPDANFNPHCKDWVNLSIHFLNRYMQQDTE